MLTSDALFNGGLIIFQEESGYRFSVDALLLAGLTGIRPQDRVVDLGTGSGVVLLIFAYRRLGLELVGLEIQPELAELAEKNICANGFSNLIRICRHDFRQVGDLIEPEHFDLLVSNPPFRRLETGRVNPHEQRAKARHELLASVSDVFKAGKYLLRQGGRLAVIYPSTRLAHLMVVSQQNGFAPKELTVIQSRPSSPACLVHLECRKGGGEELRIAPPFIIYQEGTTYSAAMERLLQDGGGRAKPDESPCSGKIPSG